MVQFIQEATFGTLVLESVVLLVQRWKLVVDEASYTGGTVKELVYFGVIAMTS